MIEITNHCRVSAQGLLKHDHESSTNRSVSSRAERSKNYTGVNNGVAFVLFELTNTEHLVPPNLWLGFQ
jgi:hypothetical protein